ncbi:MAG: hypothetical protein IJ065_02185 [Eubacterium sp.]|nr:hypothetical protein [Eubacterium sp.]
MQDIKDQMNEIHRRKEIYKDIKSLKRKIFIEGIVGVILMFMILVVIGYIPMLSQISEQTPIRQYGSLILKLPYVGYVIVAFIAFVLGIILTLLSQQWKKKKEKEREYGI